MPCALEVHSNGGLKRGHVESCPSTNKNIKSQPPQFLWPPYLAGWWLTMMSPTHKITLPFDLVVLRYHVTNSNHYNSTTRESMATKVVRMVAYLDGLLSIKSRDTLITWSWGIAWHPKTIISSLPQCLFMATKFGSMASYIEEVLTKRQYNALITWSCKVTWQTKTIIYPLPQCLLPPNLVGRIVTYLEGFLTIKSFNNLMTCLARSCD